LVNGSPDEQFVYGIPNDFPIAGHWENLYPPNPNVLIPPTFTATIPSDLGG